MSFLRQRQRDKINKNEQNWPTVDHRTLWRLRINEVRLRSEHDLL